MSFSSHFCLLDRGAVCTAAVLEFDQMYIAFVWVYVSWFHSQGGVRIGNAIYKIITGNSSCIIGRPEFVWGFVWGVVAGDVAMIVCGLLKKCHAQLVAVTIHAIWLGGFSVDYSMLSQVVK